MMAKTGLPFTVGLYAKQPLMRPWQTRFRPVPAGITFAEETQWRADLAAGRFDVVIAHNENNAVDIARDVVTSGTPALLVCHNRRSFLKTTIGQGEKGLQNYAEMLDMLPNIFYFVYISDSKRLDYGIQGSVIRPGIDAEEYGGYRGEIAEVVRVGNAMRKRNLMFDVDFQEKICQGLPNRVIGDNPDIPGSQPASSFEDLLELYRSRRCLLHVTRQDYEDGYNLAMLEAMACGMPVVALANATCPIENGVNGLIASDVAGMRAHVQRLFDDHAFAQTLGARGRDRVSQAFPMDTFIASWRQVIEVAVESKSHSPHNGSQPPPASTLRDDARFQPGGYYRSERPELAAHVPKTTKRLLDCGCGAGDFGALMKRSGVQEVIGVELVPRACELAKKVLDDAICGNIEEMEFPFEDGYFDCITFGDVLEHLADPAAVLKKAARVLAPKGVIITSIPNVRFFQVVANLVHGRWQYESAGILDRTHLRFFTAVEMVELVRQAGLEIVQLSPLSAAPKEALPRNPDGSFTLGRLTIHPMNDLDYEDFLVYQYLLIAGKPVTDRLARAQQALDARENEAAYALAFETIDGDQGARAAILAKAAARLGNLSEAISWYEKAVCTQPDDAELLGDYGIVLVAMNRAGQARPLLERAIDALPEEGRFAGAMGLVLVTEGRTQEAFTQFKRALDLNLDNENILRHLIQTASELGRPEEAEPFARRFADFYPGNLPAGCQHAALLSKLGREKEARNRIETMLLLSPNYAPAQELLDTLEGRSHETGP
ncbi:MAG TPA: methyltransferase domain-containing protein [Candidatus Hydrogenedentes bacterium]|nr:methyltransferase domain-containing protein [Candidatus Hydrogenedentota bacterium]